MVQCQDMLLSSPSLVQLPWELSMEPQSEQPTLSCPPHHWMVTEQGSRGLQDWKCQRCGAVQEHDPHLSPPANASAMRGQQQGRLARQKGKGRTSL